MINYNHEEALSGSVFFISITAFRNKLISYNSKFGGKEVWGRKPATVGSSERNRAV
jgi:hypothetical protein